MSKNKFIYGIAAVKFKEKTVGYIEKGSWDWGGSKPESTDVEAEQVPDAPVLTLLQKNSQVSPSFNLIQLDYENLQAVLGGKLTLTEVSKVECQLKVNKPENGGAPYEINDSVSEG